MKCKQTQKYLPIKKNVKKKKKTPQNFFIISIAQWLLSPGEVFSHGKLDSPNLNCVKNGQIGSEVEKFCL